MSRFSEVGSMAPHGGRKLLKFLILFENSSLLFFPGQFLSGRVLVELEDETPVLGESPNLFLSNILLLLLVLNRTIHAPGSTCNWATITIFLGEKRDSC
jgi:hypothetical protein